MSFVTLPVGSRVLETLLLWLMRCGKEPQRHSPYGSILSLHITEQAPASFSYASRGHLRRRTAVLHARRRRCEAEVAWAWAWAWRWWSRRYQLRRPIATNGSRL